MGLDMRLNDDDDDGDDNTALPKAVLLRFQLQRSSTSKHLPTLRGHFENLFDLREMDDSKEVERVGGQPYDALRKGVRPQYPYQILF